MNAHIFTLTSPLHNTRHVKEQAEQFLSAIQQHADTLLVPVGEDYARFGQETLSLLFVRTGGTEGIYLDNQPCFQGKTLYLLTSGTNNSLAASLEILAHVNAHGGRGEILHGSPAYIAARIDMLARIEVAMSYLHGQRIGVVGRPSDWLIASEVDEIRLQERWGISLQPIAMDELLAAYDAVHVVSPATRGLLRPYDNPYMDGALRLYEALQTLRERYGLTALTLRCFDLLKAVQNTGCLALSLLNAKGIPAACEGDIPALLTMIAARALTGQSSFQANPARINPETGELLFAHCTVPVDMLMEYNYDTHFESGIGVALHGELPEGPATLMKISGDLSSYFAQDVELVRNQYERDLCRTQVVLQADPATAHYLLTQPIANHHIIVSGHWQQALEELMNRSL